MQVIRRRVLRCRDDKVGGLEDDRLDASADTDLPILGEGAPAVDALVMQRYEAKKAKNFAEADRIRDELKAQGIEITDVPGGAKWSRG